MGLVQCLSSLWQAAESQTSPTLTRTMLNFTRIVRRVWRVWIVRRVWRVWRVWIVRRVWRVCEQCEISTNNAQQMLGRSQGGVSNLQLKSSWYFRPRPRLTPQLETVLTLCNPSFEGISDESSIPLAWQTKVKV